VQQVTLAAMESQRDLKSSEKILCSGFRSDYGAGVV
jgi:hypothetical protein